MLFFQQELKVDFFQKLQKTLALINNTHFRLFSILFKERQIKSSFRDFIENYSFSAEWIVDKNQFRTAIKRFLKNIVFHRLTFQKFKEFEKIFAVFSSISTKNKSLSSLKNSSSSENIFIIWSAIVETDIEMSSQATFNNTHEFFSAQLANLFKFMSQVIDSKITELKENSAIESTNSHADTTNQLQRHIFKNWNAENIEFFDSVAEETDFIINIDKHVFYRNVYTFTDRLKDMIVIKNDSKLKTIISQCFRESALIWHFIELTDLEKEILKDAFLTMWYNVIVKRFKKRISIALINMQIIKYTLENVKQLKNLRIFAQNLFRFVKTTNLISIHNQLIIAWNNLTWKFRQHISKFTEDINIRKFLKQSNSHANMWHEMTSFRNYFASKFNVDRKYSKLFFQNRNEKSIENYFNRDDRFSYFSNNAYIISRQKRNDRSFRMKIIIKIEKTSSSDREFDRDERNLFREKKNRYSNNRYRIRNDATSNFSQVVRNSDKSKSKTKTYLTQNEIEQESENDHENYHQSKALKYFDSDYDEKNDDTKIIVSLIMTSKFICRKCKSALKSNNALHRHLKSCIERKTYSIAISSNTSLITSISIRKSNVDVNKNIDSEYDFTKYQYAFIDIFLSENDIFAFVCVDIEADITLTNTSFFKSIAKNVSIRTMITSITIRDLEINKHSTVKYVIVSMYFSEKNEKKKQ